jgi:hypothetical protein
VKKRQHDDFDAGQAQQVYRQAEALVRELTALHGGSVKAYSEGAGKGCVFTLRFPLAEAVEAAI